MHGKRIYHCSSNSINSTLSKVRSRKEVKRVLCEEIPGIVFTNAKRKNESERISMWPVIDAAMWKLKQDGNEYQLKSLLKAALVIRKLCHSDDNWHFKKALNEDDYKFSEILALFFKWCLVGNVTNSNSERQCNEINERSMCLSQILMNECLSNR